MPRDKKPMLYNDAYEDKSHRNFDNMSLANSCFGSVVQADNERNDSLVLNKNDSLILSRNKIVSAVCLCLTRLMKTTRVGEGFNTSLEKSQYRKFSTITENQQSASFNIRNLGEVQEEDPEGKKQTGTVNSPDKMGSLVIRSRTVHE